MTNDKNVIIRHSKPRKSKAQKLKLWNGQGQGEWYGRYHFYIAAHTQDDAAKLIAEATGIDVSWKRLISKFYSVGGWGVQMAGVKIERGLWVCAWPVGTPERLV
jgi:hypothetical protein